jgi:hypothetical protein
MHYFQDTISLAISNPEKKTDAFLPFVVLIASTEAVADKHSR